MGDALDRLARVSEQRNRLGHADVAYLGLYRVADKPQETSLGCPARTAHVRGHVAHANPLGRVQAYELDGCGHLRVVPLYHGGGLALDEPIGDCPPHV